MPQGKTSPREESSVPTPALCPPRLWMGALVGGGTVGLTLALMAPFVLTSSPLPYMATPGHKIRRALEFIQKKQLQGLPSYRNAAAATRPRTFVDLGSGDGEGVFQAAQTGWYQQAIGLELNWTLYLLSRMRRQFFWKAHLRQSSKFLRRDFFAYSVRHADTCLIFGVTPLMEPLSRKLARECTPGTHILSYRFKLPLSNGDSNPHLLRADIIYDTEEMRVYQCK